MSITILFIIISIVWLWFGVRFNFIRDGLNLNIFDKRSDLEEVISNKKIENISKLVATIVILIIGYINYFFNHDSPVLFFVLVVGWLLFYLIQLEIALIFSRIKKLLEYNQENHQYLINKVRDTENK